MNYTDMTDEEYDALDEELTRNPPKLGPNGTGWLTQREMYKFGFSNMTVQYLLTKAGVLNKSPVQIIEEMVHEKAFAIAI